MDLHHFRNLVGQARGATDDRALGLFEQALGLWRGDAFAELDTSWLAVVRAELAMERLSAELDYIDVGLRCGQHSALLPGLSRLAQERPLDERLAGQLMLALYRDGRPAEALKHYRQVRSRLIKELGTDPSPPLQELHQRILVADPNVAGGTTPPAHETAGSVIPHQLPAQPREFTGRTRELAALDATMDTAAEAVVISAIAGAGGIGKTWLALHWAHKHADRFPDGQLFVDLHGFSPGDEPMHPGAAVRGFLDAFGVDPANIPVDVEVQISRYRSLVAGRRVLILLDNAANTAQVKPLLPGDPASTVLITSRHHLPGLITGHGARHVAVDVLADAEARALLSTRLGTERVTAEPAAVNEILTFCSGSPLALSIVAGRAHTHPGLPMAILAAELRDTGLGALDNDDVDASLPTVLSWSYRALNAEQARVFTLLGIAPGPNIGLPAEGTGGRLAPGGRLLPAHRLHR